MTESIDVQIINENELVIQAELVISDEEQKRINLFMNNTSITAEGSDFFQALINLRIKLEAERQNILCNGARKDVYPSRMTRQMSGGRLAYVQHFGKQATIENLVDIFLPATKDQISTIDEQFSYHNDWLASLHQ